MMIAISISQNTQMDKARTKLRKSFLFPFVKIIQKTMITHYSDRTQNMGWDTLPKQIFILKRIAALFILIFQPLVPKTKNLHKKIADTDMLSKRSEALFGCSV